MNEIDFKNIGIQTIYPSIGKQMDVLRLDKIHPFISGNKWFKLQFYLEEATKTNITTIATFGGAYSNHLLATAATGNQFGFSTVGIIRGEEPNIYSASLLQAKKLGMQLKFVSRTAFANKISIINEHPNFYWINEGGYGLMGADGAATIHHLITEKYTHIICAVGTGTTFAGLIKAAKPHQTIIGINVLKGNNSIATEIESLLNEKEKKKKYVLLNDFHFGGYAKHPPALIRFMNNFWKQHEIPTDIVYTSKLFFGITNLLQQNYFPINSTIMVIHSGGLQGNNSLEPGILIF
jgi:1-aminocyclopropane-1-carboxylate deaminase